MRASAAREETGGWKLGLLVMVMAPLLLNSCASFEGGAGDWSQSGRPFGTPVGSAGEFIGGGTGSNELAASPAYYKRAGHNLGALHQFPHDLHQLQPC
jgi:hypothetical protein